MVRAQPDSGPCYPQSTQSPGGTRALVSSWTNYNVGFTATVQFVQMQQTLVTDQNNLGACQLPPLFSLVQKQGSRTPFRFLLIITQDEEVEIPAH